jgi:hypothetical protein
MPAAEGPQEIFRSCVVPQARQGQEADAADAGCIGKSADAAGAEKTRGADPSGVLKRSLSSSCPIGGTAERLHAIGRWSKRALATPRHAAPARSMASANDRWSNPKNPMRATVQDSGLVFERPENPNRRPRAAPIWLSRCFQKPAQDPHSTHNMRRRRRGKKLNQARAKLFGSEAKGENLRVR